VSAEPLPEIPEVSYSVLQGRLDIANRRFPFEGTIETTFRCNLRCVHCYVNEPVGSREIQEKELSLERLQRLVDEIADAGTMHLLFTGGEVLVRPDFAELYLYTLRKGLLVTIFTNGTLVTEAIADLLDEYRPERVEITLYGMTKETYDKVTGIPGSYEKCIEGITRLAQRKIPLVLKTMALTWNQHEVMAMQAYAASLGLTFRFDGLLNPRVDCGANRNGELQMSPEQVVALDLQSPERMQSFRDFCAQFVPPPEKVVEAERVYTCGAGVTSFVVDPYGGMQMCQLSRRSSFDLKKGSFDTGWNEFFPMLRERKWQKNSICRKCNLISLCGSCPGAAEMENGDAESIVVAFCEIAHLRAQAFIGAASGHRPDATCCLGEGKLAARPPAEQARATSAGCGSGGCSHGHGEGDGAAAPALIQIQRPRPR
jgi:radical SAM protein with 4Fe4S-binding SPASM domain